VPEDPTKQEVHVTELAGPGDRWVSVTDASRIARRQEHTVRSWIAQGVLPVNPVRVGINKKTRQIRLSDLIKLTPVIDPEAAIATDWGTLDLPSIPKQQQQLAEQMAALQQEVTLQLAALGEQLGTLAGQQEQQYQTLTHRDEEQQQLLQQVRDTLTENLRSIDQAIRQELGNVLKLHSLLDDRIKARDQALRQALADQIEQSAVALRREWIGLIAQTEQALRQESAETVEDVRKGLANLDERMVDGIEERRQAHEDLEATITRQHTHTDQQFSQVTSRLEPLETILGKLQDEIQKHVEHVGQLETELRTQIDQLAAQVTGLQSTWWERAQASEQDTRQLRHDLDAQGRLHQTLQKQLDEEHKAREALAQQVSQLLKPSQRKGKRPD
jgi:DNA repair exonuclease SbcCD ATPase subunit